jgi:hypothetical protein
MAIADRGGELGIERERRFEHEVVVAEAMGLPELHRSSSIMRHG